MTYFSIFWFVGLTINPHTKFEVCSFTRYRDRVGPKIIRVGYVTQAAPLDLLLHFVWFTCLAFNQHTKFEVSSFTHSRYIS